MAQTVALVLDGPAVLAADRGLTRAEASRSGMMACRSACVHAVASDPIAVIVAYRSSVTCQFQHVRGSGAQAGTLLLVPSFIVGNCMPRRLSMQASWLV